MTPLRAALALPLVEPPETSYARIGDDRVAYQVFGDGTDIIYFAS